MIRVQEQDFDVGEEYRRFCAGRTDVGGVCMFVGLVRDFAPIDGADVSISAMTLEHYPGMTEKQLADIEAEAQSRWQLDDTLIIHRYGRMEPGDQIVMVAAASTHRDAAFEAARFLMDWLKTKAPFWKKEETKDAAQWVDARESDDTAAKRWEKK